jgi:RimJ/RimL family protein N-acetyltransferase
VSTPELRTERLVLRAWRRADRVPFAALNADAEVMEHFPAMLTVEQSDAMVDRIEQMWQSTGFGLWAVEEQVSGRFIGYVGLSSPTWQAHFTPCVEIGWRLARWGWGRGYATEAATAAMQWAFDTLELPRGELVSFTVQGNLRSRRVMEKLGFEHDPADDFDHPDLPDWEHRRHVLYRRSRGR